MAVVPMTSYTEWGDIGKPGKARKRVKDLLKDAWEVKEYSVGDEEGWYIRAPMDQGIYQRWRRMDKEWAELQDIDLTLQDIV